MDFIRRAKERRIAEEIARELHRVMGPFVPEMLTIKSDAVAAIFTAAFDSHNVVDERAAERILHHVPVVLADLNREYAELNSRIDAAMRPPMPNATSRGQR